MTADRPPTVLERQLEQALGVEPSEALRRRIDERVGRAMALAPAIRSRRPWTKVLLIAGAVLLMGAGYYAATQTPLESVLDPGQPLHCSGLLGAHSSMVNE